MLNEKIIEIFNDVADSHDIDENVKKQLRDLLNGLASGKIQGDTVDDKIGQIFSALDKSKGRNGN